MSCLGASRFGQSCVVGQGSVAGVRAGARFTLSTPVGLPAEVRHALGGLDVPVFLESDDEWLQRISGRATPVEGETAEPRATRVRLVGSTESVAETRARIAEVTSGDPDLAVYDNEVTTAGRLELLPFLHEQSITITAHRFGNRDDWSAEVI